MISDPLSRSGFFVHAPYAALSRKLNAAVDVAGGLLPGAGLGPWQAVIGGNGLASSHRSSVNLSRFPIHIPNVV